MGLKVFSQLDYAEKGGLIDDCGPSALAAAIYHSSNGAQNPGVDGCILAAAKAGRRDTNGKSEGTTFVQIVAAAKFVNATLTVAPNWTKAVAAMKTGKAVCVAFRAPIATPKNAISAWQKRSMKRRPGHTYAHYATLAIVDGQFVFADPTMSGKDAEQFGVIITEAEAKTLAHWGIAEVNAKRSTPMAWICATKTVAPAPVPVAPAPVAVAPVAVPVAAPVVAPVVPAAPTPAPAPKIAVEAPRSHAEPRKVAEGTKTPDAVQAQLDQIGKADWGALAADGLAVINAAAAATRKEKGMNRIWAGIKYVAANTQIDEIALDFVRTFLTVSISVALGLGIPLLDIQGGDFRTIVSAGLASGLGIVVKALDRDNGAYGLKKN
jgi:hypothetical protein